MEQELVLIFSLGRCGTNKEKMIKFTLINIDIIISVRGKFKKDFSLIIKQHYLTFL